MNDDVLPESTAEPSQRASRWLIAIVFCGMAFRLMLLLFRADDLRTDPDAYVALAKTIVSTGGFCKPGTTEPTAFRPPLYPFLLASLLWTGLKTTAAVGLINLIAGAVHIIATWWIARVVGLRGIWPGVAAAASCCDPLLLRYSVLPMTEVLSAALISVALLNVLKVLSENRQSGGKQHSTATAIIAGIGFGLAGLCRPIALVTCAVVSVLLVVRSLLTRPTKQLPMRLAVLPALTAIVVLLPWIVRNYHHFDRLIPATTHGGYTLLLGNNEVFYDEVVLAPGSKAWSGDSLEKWQQQLSEKMSAEGVNMTSEADVDQWMYVQAKAAIAADSTTFARACWLRWQRFWALRPTVDSGGMPGWMSWGAATWFVVVWLGLAGSLFSPKAQRVCVQTLWLAIVSFLLIHTFYWTNARMRAPLTGVFAVLAACGWQKWIGVFGWQQKRDAAP